MRTAATAARPAPRRAAAPRPARPRLEVVAPRQPKPPRAPFVLLSLVVVAVGLLALLGLNTVVAEDAFRLHELERRSASLAEDELRLRREVAAAEAPEVLAGRAAALGLVPASDPVFLRLSDGAVLGVPAPATTPAKPKPAATAAKPAAKPSPKPAASAQPTAKPGAKPAATAKPTAKPAATAKPTAKPSPAATP